MATIRAGNLGLTTRPIQRLADWRKIREHDWRSIQMGLHEVSVWDCKKQAWSKPLPPKIGVPLSLSTSFINPLGRSLPTLRDKRYDRIVGWSGLGSRAAFGKAFEPKFQTPAMPVPKRDIARVLDKRYRTVLCYERRDRYILLTPDRQNPNGDYLILCLPQAISWRLVKVGVCGTERVRLADEFGMDQLFGHRREYEFAAPGPYQALQKARLEFVRLNFLRPSAPRPAWSDDVPNRAKSPLWRQILKDDATRKKVLAGQLGGHTGAYGTWSIEHTPGYYLERRRTEAELSRLLKAHG